MTIAIFEDVGAFFKRRVSVLPTSSNDAASTPGGGGGVSDIDLVPVRRGSSRGAGTTFTTSLLRPWSSSNSGTVAQTDTDNGSSR